MPIEQMERERETQRREVAAGWSHAVSGDAEQHLVLIRPVWILVNGFYPVQAFWVQSSPLWS